MSPKGDSPLVLFHVDYRTEVRDLLTRLDVNNELDDETFYTLLMAIVEYAAHCYERGQIDLSKEIQHDRDEAAAYSLHREG